MAKNDDIDTMTLDELKKRVGKGKALIAELKALFPGLVVMTSEDRVHTEGRLRSHEPAAFAAVYAIVVGSVVFRELSLRTAAHSFVQAATRSGLVLFIVAAAQSLAFILTLQQVPHAVGEMMLSLSGAHGTWLFMLLSIAVLIVMGSVLEGAAALIIFGPLLLPVAVKLGIDPLHFGVVLVISMGLGLLAPPLGLGLYGACLIGNVPIEQTVKPILGYLGLLLLCLLVIAFVPAISTALPRAFGY